MTFPRSYNATGARRDGVEVRTCADDVLGLGLVTVKTPLGNEVRAYDLERTLCDLLRGQSTPDVQVVNPAMKAYARSSRKDVQKLLGYSKALGVEAKVRNYLFERLMERISLSEWRDCIVIKGGMLISSLIRADKRSTKDLDTTVRVRPYARECRAGLPRDYRRRGRRRHRLRVRAYRGYPRGR